MSVTEITHQVKTTCHPQQSVMRPPSSSSNVHTKAPSHRVMLSAPSELVGNAEQNSASATIPLLLEPPSIPASNLDTSTAHNVASSTDDEELTLQDHTDISTDPKKGIHLDQSDPHL